MTKQIDSGQLWFDFDAPVQAHKKQQRRRITVDYDRLYRRLQQGPLTFDDIKTMTGLPRTAVPQVIVTLSEKYPVWKPSRGVYKLMDDSDYENISRFTYEEEE